MMEKKNSTRANIVGGLSGAIFFGGLLLAFLSGQFLVGLFLTLALTSLVSTLGTGEPKAISGGFQGSVFFVGLALLAAYSWWWPGILFLFGISALLGGMNDLLVALISRWSISSDHASTHEEPLTYRPYQQGYERQEKSPVQDSERRDEEEEEISSYEQPQANYPQMLPPLR